MMPSSGAPESSAGAGGAPLTVGGLRSAYASGEATPGEIVRRVYERIAASGETHSWIHLLPEQEVLRRVEKLEGCEGLPLYGVPFAVKDNIDVGGVPTTAGCAAFSYTPAEDAFAVRRLLDSGAILIGKTNLDQFATGLVGARSPYGSPRCVFNGEYISGGSSSGSAVAVARGEVAFALGTDTAGSGRVPAAFNDIVGLKPTRGRVSTRGVVPACRSLDCVSIFARSCADAFELLLTIDGFDPADPYSRSGLDDPMLPGEGFDFGVPRPADLEFFGDLEASALYHDAVARLERAGGRRREFDYGPFREAAELLYSGPWVAERDAAVGEFLRSSPTAVHPVVRSIIFGSDRHSAADAFRGMHRLAELRRTADAAWAQVDMLVLPTTPTIYRVDEVLAEPYALNTRLGLYTNFMNLLDLCGLAIPAGFRENRTPFGVTLVGPAGRDRFVSAVGERYEATYRREVQLPALEGASALRGVRLAVVGAHLSGQPLNYQLVGRNARLVCSCATAPRYRLYALADSRPAKPGLARVPENGGSIDVEVWEMSVEAFGSFVAEVPAPMAIGNVELQDGSWVKGFVCEPAAIARATDITHLGGWRAFLVSDRA